MQYSPAPLADPAANTAAFDVAFASLLRRTYAKAPLNTGELRFVTLHTRLWKLNKRRRARQLGDARHDDAEDADEDVANVLAAMGGDEEEEDEE